MTKAIVGIIGGSGVYHLPGLEDIREEWVTTPWGDASDALHFGRIGTADAVFLPRHGRGHKLSPSGINYRANIDALKRAGVTDIVSVSACGSFKPELYPGLFVLVDQFVDRTFARQSSFFGNGCVAHVSLARPCCNKGSPAQRRPKTSLASKAVRISASKARNFPRLPNRSPTRPMAAMSSV